MKKLLIRTLTGLIFVLVVVGSIWIGPYTFLALFALIAAATLFEFYSLPWAVPVSLPMKTGGCLIGLLMFACSFLWSSGWVDFSILLIPFVLIFGLFILSLYQKRDNPFEELAKAVFGLIYIVLPLSLLNHFAFFLPGDDPMYTPTLLLGFFLLIWSNDTGAYLVGISIGKHRLFERVSPKKSWEGFFGGVLFTLIIASLIASYDDLLSLYDWMAISVIVSVFGTFGDLSESLLKRSLGIKDSGTILPGHGGLLDRFDSILFAGPVAVLYLWWIS